MSPVGWLHCPAGASGDMLLGALVGAGVPVPVMQGAVDAVGVEQVVLSTREVTRAGVAAVQVDVAAARSRVVRTWANVRGLLIEARLAEPVRATALEVFGRLARVEAEIHRTSPEQVHFHEVGALDAIADVVGTAAGLHWLGLEALHCSAVALGLGMSRSEHGLLPVPGPAVLALLREAGGPVHSGPPGHELCTPTGAALLAATVRHWGGLPPMRVQAVGSGAGHRDLDELPNVLRLVVGEPVDAGWGLTGEDGVSTEALVLEANVDDLDPRLWPAVLGRLLAAGAADAWLTPIVMKKGRPAHTLSVLAGAEQAEQLRRVVFTETPTLGLREVRVTKRALDRACSTVEVDGQPVRVKTARLNGLVVTATPEYEDVLAAAAALDRPAKAVLAAAVAAAHAAGVDR